MPNTQKNVLIEGEIKTLSLLGKADIDVYISKSNALQKEVEDALDEYFGDQKDSDRLACEIMKEHLRELYSSEAVEFLGKSKADQYAAYCAKVTTYKHAQVIVEHLVKQDKLTVSQGIVKKYEENVDKVQKASSDGEFILYVRGYTKYWRDKTDDENSQDIVTDGFDAEFWAEVLDSA